MTDRYDDDARAILQRLPIPEHRDTFWDELDRRLDALPATAPLTMVERTGPADPRPSEPEPGAVIDLTRPASDRPRQARGRLAAVAAVLLIVGMTAAAVVAVLARDDGEGVQVATPVTTATTATTAAPPTEPPASVVAGPDEGAAAAQAATLDWIDLLAAGDMAGAWELLGPAAQAGWGSYEAFEEARTAFAEGFATWASAEGRQVGVATVARTDQGALHVVTLTGVRAPEGNREDGAVALPVREDTNGRYLVEPPSPAGALTVEFTSPVPAAMPPVVDAEEAVVVATAGPSSGLYLVVDGEVVTPVLGSGGTASYVPPGGWIPGRHAVAAVVDSGAGPAATAIVFDVA